MGDALMVLGGIVLSQGNWDLSEQYVREALTIWQDISFPGKIGNTLAQLARLALIKADFERAEQLAQESLAVLSETDHRGKIAERSLS